MNFNQKWDAASRMILSKRVFLLAVGFFSLQYAAAQALKGSSQGRTDEIRTLIIFFDGLRPDYITAEGMPRLYAFKQQACYGMEHHSVFPTVTRVNSSSYSTGSYPATHGLMSNTVYFPQVEKVKGLNTGEAAELNRIDSATILTHSFTQQVMSDLGAPPTGGKSDTAGHAWVTDALMKYGLVPEGPLVNAVWYSEPDGAAHQYGIGSPQAWAALKLVDAQFGRILDSLKSRKIDDKTNILISTDHGFVTYIGKQRLADFLIKQGLKKDAA